MIKEELVNYAGSAHNLHKCQNEGSAPPLIDGMPGVIFYFLFPGDMMDILAVDFKATELKHTAIQESS